MIYFSKEPILLWQPNIIILDLEENLGHIYVSRDTYDQAVIISDLFAGDFKRIREKIGGADNQSDICEYMFAILPSPIKVLSPFFSMIDDDVLLDIDNEKQLIGVLSYLSMSINFKAILMLDYKLRASLVYTKSILLDYQGHYEAFNFKISKTLGNSLVDIKENNQIKEESFISVNNKNQTEQQNNVINKDDPDEIISADFDLNEFNNLLQEKWNAIPTKPIKTKKEEIKEDTKGVVSNFEAKSDADAYSKIVDAFSI